VGVLLLLGVQHVWVMLPLMATYGFLQAAPLMLFPLLTAESMGLKRYGTISGIVSAANTLGAAFGPPVAGSIFDATHSYVIAYSLFGRPTSPLRSPPTSRGPTRLKYRGLPPPLRASPPDSRYASGFGPRDNEELEAALGAMQSRAIKSALLAKGFAIPLDSVPPSTRKKNYARKWELPTFARKLEYRRPSLRIRQPTLPAG
jgi:MFS family permease